MNLETVSENICFSGVQGFFSHESKICGCSMGFSVFIPPQAKKSDCPAVFWLSGLTCTEENFTLKAGAQRYAAELGLILVAPDTSPRGLNIPGEDDSYDFGSGASFYIDATQNPWSRNYQMYSYITTEFQSLIINNFPVAPERIGISGHSMGGHGALIMGLNNPHLYKSVSAFSPIVAPMKVPWGIKAFKNYLGSNQKLWQQYDTTQLLRDKKCHPKMLLIEQGGDDPFLEEQLQPDLLTIACDLSGQRLNLRIRKGYDHSYYFIASFIGEHLSFHANNLK